MANRFIPATWCGLFVMAMMAVPAFGDVPGFEQVYTYPVWNAQTPGTIRDGRARFDTTVTYIPFLPPDNDFGIVPISTSLHYDGPRAEWRIIIDCSAMLFRLHRVRGQITGSPIFALEGLPAESTATIRVRMPCYTRIARGPSSGGRNGMYHALLSVAPFGEFRADINMEPGMPTNVTDTLFVSIPVRAGEPFSFAFLLQAMVEFQDDSDRHRMEAGFTLDFLDLPPNARVVNAHGYSQSGPVATQLALARSEVTSDRVLLEWFAATAVGQRFSLERRAWGEAWQPVAELLADGRGFVRWEDRDLPPGIYDYRLVNGEGAERGVSVETRVEVPSSSTMLSGRIAPDGHRVDVRWARTMGAPAVVELFDAMGRRLARSRIGAGAAGVVDVPLTPAGPLSPGLYFICTSSSEGNRTARVGFVR